MRESFLGRSFERDDQFGRDDVESLTSIPFELDLRPLMKRVHLEPDTDDARHFEDLVTTARDVARPKAAYAESFVEAKGEDTVRIDGVTFTSRALRKLTIRRSVSLKKVFPPAASLSG